MMGWVVLLGLALFSHAGVRVDRVLAGAFAGGFGFRRAFTAACPGYGGLDLFAEPLGALQVVGGVAVLVGIYITGAGRGSSA